MTPLPIASLVNLTTEELMRYTEYNSTTALELVLLKHLIAATTDIDEDEDEDEDEE